MSYQVGEVLLMEHHSRLQAVRVVKAEQVSDTEIKYGVVPLELENDSPGWIQP